MNQVTAKFKKIQSYKCGARKLPLSRNLDIRPYCEIFPNLRFNDFKNLKQIKMRIS